MLILSWQENPKSSKSLKLENLFASSKYLLLLVKKIHREWPLDTGGQTKPFTVASSTTSRHSIPHGVGIEHKFNGQWSQSCLVLCKKKDESRRQQTLYIYVIIVLERVTMKTLVKTLNSQVIVICLPFQWMGLLQNPILRVVLTIIIV